jgi:uncharacterized protein
MPLDLLEKIIVDVFHHADIHSLPLAEFHFSGGEPLMGGIDFFKSMLQLQKKHNTKLIKVVNSIQTNGTLMNEDWVSFFKLNNFGISISLDGIQYIQDKQRPKVNGKGSFTDVKKCIELLHANDLPFGLISVVTKGSLGHVESIIKFLLSCEPVNIVFLPCTDRHSIKNNDWAEFLERAFDIWIDPEVNINAIPVRCFKTILLHLCGQTPHGRACDYTPDCLYPNISPDGIVSICDQFVGKPDGILGDIKIKSLTDILQQKRSPEYLRKFDSLHESCEVCLYKNLCHGGCAYRKSINQGIDYLCESRKRIFSYIDSKIEEILEKLEYQLGFR